MIVPSTGKNTFMRLQEGDWVKLVTDYKSLDYHQVGVVLSIFPEISRAYVAWNGGVTLEDVSELQKVDKNSDVIANVGVSSSLSFCPVCLLDLLDKNHDKAYQYCNACDRVYLKYSDEIFNAFESEYPLDIRDMLLEAFAEEKKASPRYKGMGVIRKMKSSFNSVMNDIKTQYFDTKPEILAKFLKLGLQSDNFVPSSWGEEGNKPYIVTEGENGSYKFLFEESDRGWEYASHAPVSSS